MASCNEGRLKLSLAVVQYNVKGVTNDDLKLKVLIKRTSGMAQSKVLMVRKRIFVPRKSICGKWGNEVR